MSSVGIVGGPLKARWTKYRCCGWEAKLRLRERLRWWLRRMLLMVDLIFVFAVVVLAVVLFILFESLSCPLYKPHLRYTSTFRNSILPPWCNLDGWSSSDEAGR